jgi:putative ABC transport system permease protein
MKGILRLAFKLLINDNVKFTALLVGITFAVFLMVEMTSLFAGILKKSSSTVVNIGAKVWVMDPAVQTIASSIGMPAYVLDAVRSTDGVKYAVPLYSGSALVILRDGTYQAVSVIGLDDASLFGWPIMKQGKIEDIYAENGFIAIDDAEFVKLKNPTLRTNFELNDHRGVVVGVATVASSGLFGTPTLYTTYKRAVTYIPTTRYTTSYILVEPKSAADIAISRNWCSRWATWRSPKTSSWRGFHASTSTRPGSAATSC